MTTPIAISGSSLHVQFQSFSLANYDLFLKYVRRAKAIKHDAGRDLLSMMEEVG